MTTQLQPETNIPSQVYELAARHGVGTPLKQPRRLLIFILLIFFILFYLAVAGWLIYRIYEFITFNNLSHTYPNASRVPYNQLDNYLWLQVEHDSFWRDLTQIAAILFSPLASAFAIFSTYRTKLYICTDGLLKIYKKKDEAIRWDEIKELFTSNGIVSRLIKQDDSILRLPSLLLAGRNKTLNTIIIDEVTRCLLPEMLTRYERGETITFGDLEVNQQGIYRPGGMVYWQQIGNIALDKETPWVYYSELQSVDDETEQNSKRSLSKWHAWRKYRTISETWPNLPVFVPLVNTLFDQNPVSHVEEVPLTQQPSSLKEAAALMIHRRHRRINLTVMGSIIAVLGIFALGIWAIIYQSDQEQQQEARAIPHLRSHFTQLAHKPFTVHVPGEHCGNGKNFWLDDEPRNQYVCQKDGLRITQKYMEYQAGEWFTFVPDKLSTLDDFSTVNYFPHHYRVQVKATILSGEPGTCVWVTVHTQNFQGRQSFNICADGSWGYYYCDLHCNTFSLILSGNLPRAKNSYLITVDVTDKVISLSVDNKLVTPVFDSMYNSTNQLELSLCGDKNTREPITALFSDFSYVPLN